MTNKQRITQLEKQAKPKVTMTNEELAERINRVLLSPLLVTQKAYNRIIELLAIAQARKVKHDNKKQTYTT